MGAQKLADKALLRKLQIETSVGHRLKKPANWFFDFFCQYGLDPFRAATLTLAFIGMLSGVIFLGDYSAFTIEDKGEWYMPSISFGHQAMAKQSGYGSIYRFPFAIPQAREPANAGTVSDARQGTCESENAGILEHGVHAVAYAFDTFIPTFDTSERKSCDIARQNVGWFMFKVIAMLFGWVCTWLTVVTWSGIFRRNVEP